MSESVFSAAAAAISKYQLNDPRPQRWYSRDRDTRRGLVRCLMRLHAKYGSEFPVGKGKVGV